MAAIIDGSTYPGFFKLTQDDGVADAYFLAPKHNTLFQASDATSGTIKILGNADLTMNTNSATEDENGNVLNTSDKVARYLSDNRQR